MSTTTEKPAEKPSAAERDPKISAIRDIIFGENIKEINDEFDEIKAAIQEHRHTLEERMNQVRTELEKTVQQMQQDTEKQLKEIQEDTISRLTQLEGSVPSNTNLGRMFEEIGRKLQQGESAAASRQNGSSK